MEKKFGIRRNKEDYNRTGIGMKNKTVFNHGFIDIKGVRLRLNKLRLII
jgi:hypothetical protein